MSFQDMLDHLRKTRHDLRSFQDGKLLIGWNKHGDYRTWNSEIVVGACLDELDELKKALEPLMYDSDEKFDVESVKDEILDVRNTTEFLWDYITQGKVTG